MAAPSIIEENGSTPSLKRARFVAPTATSIALSDGDWIRVKSELTYGEAQRVNDAVMKRTGDDGDPFTIDLAVYQIERILSWVLEWSFTDEAGKRVPVSRATIEALDTATGAEITIALNEHIAAVAERKNAQGIRNE